MSHQYHQKQVHPLWQSLHVDYRASGLPNCLLLFNMICMREYLTSLTYSLYSMGA